MKVICQNNDYYPASLKVGGIYEIYLVNPKNIFKIKEDS